METNNGKAVWEGLLQLSLRVFEGIPRLTHTMTRIHDDRIVFIRNHEQQKVWMTLIPAILKPPYLVDLRRHADDVVEYQSMLAWAARSTWMVTPEQFKRFYPPAAYLDLTWQAYTLEGVMIDGE